MSLNNILLEKYDRPVPRYTSYPTVPFWKSGIDETAWKKNVAERSGSCNRNEGISLYIHLPFCESLCVYCGCNKRITTNHSVEEEYLSVLLQEWRLYRETMDRPPLIREIHLGGGTPTFFSPENLERLITGLLKDAVIHPDYSFGLEGHPGNTSRAHMDRLYELGFRRISYGVQDLNDEVQKKIRRIQPFDMLETATKQARAAGFVSVNFDLIYGLPAQTEDRLRHTIFQSATLKPDRIAFYSYAHTPWVNGAQRLIDEKDLPSPVEKLALYESGKAWLTELGYTHIGMDHFALPSDELCRAWQDLTLHRNFMGYTTHHSGMLVGLGVSAISDTGTAFAQNDKGLMGYYRSIREGNLAVRKGYFLNEEDRLFRRHILDIACKGFTVFNPDWHVSYERYALPRLLELAEDGMVNLQKGFVSLTEKGRPFLRHVCKAFDLHLLREDTERPSLFSKAI